MNRARPHPADSLSVAAVGVLEPTRWDPLSRTFASLHDALTRVADRLSAAIAGDPMVIRMAALAVPSIAPHRFASGALLREGGERAPGLRSLDRAEPRLDDRQHRLDPQLSFDQPLVIVRIAVALDLPQASHGRMQAYEHGRRDTWLTVLTRGAADAIRSDAILAHPFSGEAKASLGIQKAGGPRTTLGRVVRAAPSSGSAMIAVGRVPTCTAGVSRRSR